MSDPTPLPGNWAQALAVRQQRLDLIARVLEIQRLFIRDWGREPTVDEVAKAIEGR